MSFKTITIKTKNFELSEELRGSIDKKFSTLERLLPKGELDVICEMELEKITGHHHSGKIYRAEVNVSFAGKVMRAEATEETMEIALDKVKNEMKRELERVHSRTESLFRKGARRAKELFRRA